MLKNDWREGKMKIDIKLIKKIYMSLGDDKSKEMLKNRLMYSITNDSSWIFENIKLVPEGKLFIKEIDKCAVCGEMVIFGAGTRGRLLYQMFEKYPWRCFVDNYPQARKIQEIPLISSNIFLENYKGEYIFITPKFKNELIHKQLIYAGVPSERIINVGKIQNDLTKKQYFDLEYLESSKKREVFIDVGGYDGMTSVYFNEWSKKNAFSYIFEPDIKNIEKCNENLSKCTINYKIIPKGVWSKETTLHFNANADVSSSISDVGDSIIDVTTLDKEMKDENPSFIKMDIEGSELHALIGAKQTIRINKPKLAISVYHKPEDIWEIPSIILQYNPYYKLYLRHYSLTDSDTILYAVP